MNAPDARGPVGPRHFIDLWPFSGDELRSMLKEARRRKAARAILVRRSDPQTRLALATTKFFVES